MGNADPAKPQRTPLMVFVVVGGERAGKFLGRDSIEKFWLEFRLEKSLEFWLEIPY